MVAKSIIESALSLPAEDRLQIIEELWQSFVSDPDTLPIPAWHRDAIDEALQDEAAHPEDESPADEVMNRVRQRKS